MPELRAGTIEARIATLLATKKGVARDLLSEGSGVDLAAMGDDDLLALLSLDLRLEAAPINLYKPVQRPRRTKSVQSRDEQRSRYLALQLRDGRVSLESQRGSSHRQP